MDITTYYAKMADIDVIQRLPFERKRRRIDGYGDDVKIAFQNGDLVYERETNLIHIIYYRERKDVETGDIIEVVTNVKDEWSPEKIIWLPRRADLQFIYHDQMPKGTSHYEVLRLFASWAMMYEASIRTHVQRGFSMEKIWLMFVIDKIDSKRWDISSERWVRKI